VNPSVDKTERYCERRGQKSPGAGILKFITTADCEALDTESPCVKDVADNDVPRDAPGGVGTAPMEEVEVEVEEEEEEDPDVHFK